MIKLKNLWKIALAAMTMSAMLVACDTETKGGDSDSGSSVSATGVYTATLKKEAIGTGWGASDTQETIKFILAPKTVVDEIKDGIITTETELFIDANKCYVYANNDVDNGRFTSATVTEGTYVQPAGYEEYTGIAITKDAEGNYIVKVDMTKINKSILLAKGAAETKVSERDPWEAVETISTDYVPMMLGSVTANEPAEVYDLVVWGAGLAIAEADTNAFPTSIVKEPKQVKTSLSGMTVICSNLGNLPITFADDIATAEFVYDFSTNAWGDVTGGVAFGICSDESWSQKFTGAAITALDTEVEVTFGAANNNTVAADILEDGKTYVVTINAKNNTVKISAK